jgi:protein transport protein SEC31
MEYVTSSDLASWKETLALLGTYGKSEEFPALCEALGERLFVEVGDSESATLCYMCAVNVHRTIEFWVADLERTNEALGHLDTVALQRFVEKVVVLTEANPVSDLGEKCVSFFSEYANLLSNQGRLDVASRYLRGDGVEASILRDRLYHGGSKPIGSRPPAFPFPKETVTAGRTPSTTPLAAPAKSSGRAVSAGAPRPGGATNAADAFSQPAVTQQQQQHYGQASAAPAQVPVQAQAQQPVVAAVAPAAAVAAASPSEPQLQPGWLQQFDPNTNRYYYVNPTTQQSLWEAPLAVEVAAVGPGVMHVPQQHQQQHQQHHQHHHHQQQQQQQFQQQSPTIMQTAAQVAASPIAAAPVAAAAPVEQVQPGVVPPEVVAVGVLVKFASENASPAERRQIGALTASFDALTSKAQANAIEFDVLEKLGRLAACLGEPQNVAGATAIQQDLANTAWNAHKDWIRGMKILIQIIRR